MSEKEIKYLNEKVNHGRSTDITDQKTQKY